MVSWRAVGAGVLAFPPVVGWAALAEPFALLVAGAVPGVVAAVLAEPGVRSGLVHGALAGGACTLLSWGLLLGWLTLAPPDRVAPGFGLSVVLLALFGLLATAESGVGGVLVGLVRSS